MKEDLDGGCGGGPPEDPLFDVGCVEVGPNGLPIIFRAGFPRPHPRGLPSGWNRAEVLLRRDQELRGRVLMAEDAQDVRQLVGRARCLVGVEVDLPSLGRNETVSLRVAGDAAHLPFADERFDLVTANMVLEHLPNPVVQFREIARVLRPGGRFVFHTPNALGHPTLLARLSPEWLKAVGVRLIENRREEDRFPTHYRANTVDRIAELAKRSGLVVADLLLVSSSAMFSVVLPLAIMELFWIRWLRRARLAGYRSNLIGVLVKPAEEPG